MKHGLFFYLCLFFCSLTAGELPVAELFFRHGCRVCNSVEKGSWSAARKQFGHRMNFVRSDLAVPAHYLRLSAAQEFFGDRSNEPVFVLINGNRLLAGDNRIDAHLTATIEEELRLQKPPSFSGDADATELLRRRFSSFTLMTVLVAGAIDGINPCVFATLIFFISLLRTGRNSKRRFLWTGLFYCAACFMTYFLLGFGAFHVLQSLRGWETVRSILDWSLLAGLLLLSVLSFKDAWRYRRHPGEQSVLLKLPGRLQTAIHVLLRRATRRSFWLPGVFFVGVAVTLIESACTGQVYVPTLILLGRDGGVSWFFYLFLYNIAFILPLLVLFACAWHELNTLRLVQWSRRHVVPGKILMGSLFLVFAWILHRGMMS